MNVIIFIPKSAVLFFKSPYPGNNNNGKTGTQPTFVSNGSYDCTFMKKSLLLIIIVLFRCGLHAEDGYRLWLRYDQIANTQLLMQYRNTISGIQVLGNTPTLDVGTK